MRFVLSLVAFSGAWSLAVACGTSTPSTPPPKPTPPWADIDGGDPEAGTEIYLTDLTESQRKKLCDWTAGTEGGYGKITRCDGGSVIVNFKDQNACLAQFLGLCDSVFVLDYEACIKVIGADVCADSLYNAPECFGVEKCLGKIDGGPAPNPDAGDGGG